MRDVRSRPLFRRDTAVLSPLETIKWWEARRIPYNAMVGAAGLVSIALVLTADLISESFFHFTYAMPDPPLAAVFAILLYAIAANACYTGGWIAEIVARKAWPAKASRLKDSFLWGSLFSMVLTLLPGVVLLLLLPVEVVTGRDARALQELIRKGDTMEATALLLRKPEEIKSVTHDKFELTPLCLALENPQEGMIRALLDAGADPKADCFGQTALAAADRTKNLEIVRLLVAHGADAAADHGAALTEAARSGDAKNVQFLLDHGADANAVEEAGRGDSADIVHLTPLKAAAGAGSVDVLKLLLDHGAKVGFRGKNDDAALHLAAEGASPAKAVGWLLDHGADANSRGHAGRTPLHAAVDGLLVFDSAAKTEQRRTDLDTIRLLLARGADINARDDADHTPLFYAESRKQADVARLLREHGAASR
jgi:ankyrin repeat protein